MTNNNSHIRNFSALRAEPIRLKLRRNRLVFMQCGAVFAPIVNCLIEEIGGIHIDVSRGDFPDHGVEYGKVLITGVEAYSSGRRVDGQSLGKLRIYVQNLVDRGLSVCLISTIPKIGFKPVPGSSILDDSAFHCISILQREEIPHEMEGQAGNLLPALAFSESQDLRRVFSECLQELGVEVLTELDTALFEAQLSTSFLDYLSSRVLDAMRGSGLLHEQDQKLAFSVPERLEVFRQSVADSLAEVILPQDDLGAVMGDLWKIEHLIRRAVRNRAIKLDRDKWRKCLLPDNVAQKVVDRAQGDGNVGIDKLWQLRDPIEWLTLGELLDVIRSKKFGNIGVEATIWRRFAEDVLPIRNRVAHMRLLKKADKTTAASWSRKIEAILERADRSGTTEVASPEAATSGE